MTIAEIDTPAGKILFLRMRDDRGD